MAKTRKLIWDFYALIILLSFSVLQVLRWRLLPQFMDDYYHLLTAWGFIQAGGYSGWDFWQYAPVGRVHMYPPLYHLVLAFFLKLGVNKIILIKSLETLCPIVFLFFLWKFVRKNYNGRLAFFTLACAGASFSFYLSLFNYIPATLALMFGLYAFDQLLENRWLRPLLFIALCFYTHIGVSWFFVLGLFLFGLFDTRYRKASLWISAVSLVLSAPIIFKQAMGLQFISLKGIGEKYFIELKVIECLLALFALRIIIGKNRESKYRLFLALFIASFIFLPYPYRFISGQGYLPVIFLSAVGIDSLYERYKDKALYFKYVYLFLVGYCLLFSTTLLTEKDYERDGKINFKIYYADTALINMAFPLRNERIASTSLWFPDEYAALRKLIAQHSQGNDIIYSELFIPGVALASISGRATANALFPEIGPMRAFDPLAVSKLILLPKDRTQSDIKRIASAHTFIKVGEGNIFAVYKNSLCRAKVDIRKASISFRVLAYIFFIFAALFWQAQKIEVFLTRNFSSLRVGGGKFGFKKRLVSS